MESESDLARIVRDGLFLAASRTYAEQYIEPFIRAQYDLGMPVGGDYDALDAGGRRYEIKASKVLAKTGNLSKVKTLISRLRFESDNLPTSRMVAFADASKVSYNANIQNVKRDHFEILIYVLLFEDCVKVFFAPVNEIEKGKFKNWSDKHGRYDAHGKSGQFPISRASISWHLKNYLEGTFTYDHLAKVYKKVSIDLEDPEYYSPK